MNHLKFYLAFLITALIMVAASCATSGHHAYQDSKEKILQSTELIEVATYDYETGNFNTQFVCEPDDIAEIRSWIKNYAWPPIDQNTTGAVGPRGYFTVFEDYSPSSIGFRIYVYGSTSRSRPDQVHVSNEAWKALLALLPDME